MSGLTVKEVYLRVIEATIAASKSDFERLGAGQEAVASLDELRANWQSRLQISFQEREEQQAAEMAAAAAAAGTGGIGADMKIAGTGTKAKKGGVTTAAPVANRGAVTVSVLGGGVGVGIAGVSGVDAAVDNHDDDDLQNGTEGGMALPPMNTVLHNQKLPPLANLLNEGQGQQQRHLPSIHDSLQQMDNENPNQLPSISNNIPQYDGADGTSDDDNDLDDEDAGANSSDKSEDLEAKAGKKRQKVDKDSDDSDLDNTVADALGEEQEMDNYILAQYEKVTRKQDKWKVQLKEGVAHINGVDYLFNKMICEVTW